MPNQTSQPNKYSITAKEYSNLGPEERKQWSPVKEKYEKVPLFCKISLIITVFCAIVYVIACISDTFADFFNVYISSIFRFAFAKISNIFPFSFAEFIIVSLPILLFLVLWYLLKFRCDTKKSSKVSLLCILSSLSLLLSCFVLTFATGYRGSPLSDKLGIEKEDVSTEELYNASKYLSERINELSNQIDYRENSFSTMPYDFYTMNSKLIESYDKFCDGHGFINNFSSRLKPIILSEAMSYTHITGVYTFFTGEANVNINFPDYTIPFTSAHELAHQRGISREDEANMIAFLVCAESDDIYLRYSAYMNMYGYVANALYKADKQLYFEIAETLDVDVRLEQIAYNDFFDKYEGSSASVVTGTINDVYLKGQGTKGKQSYGMVVDLTVAYLKSQNLI